MGTVFGDLTQAMSAIVLTTFGEPVVFHLEGQGQALPGRGVFTAAHESVDVSSGVAVLSVQPVLEVAQRELPTTPTEGDAVTVQGQLYLIVEVRPDGHGFLKLLLHKGGEHMKHPRTLIRQAVKDRLVAQLPQVDPRITEARISIHRSTPLFAAKLPSILIYTRDERIEDAPASHPGIRYRKLELSVEVITSGEAAIEDADTLAQAIEAILDADETLGLLVQGTRLTRTEVDHDGDGDTPVLAARMTFEVSYWTKPVVDEGVLPLQVLVSWVPEIGTTHEHSYQPVGAHHAEPTP